MENESENENERIYVFEEENEIEKRFFCADSGFFWEDFDSEEIGVSPQGG